MSRRNSEPPKTAIRRRHFLYVAAAILIALILTTYFLFISPAQPKEPKAAIIDQLGSSRLPLGIRDENSIFIEATRQRLLDRFSSIDYYSNNATVENYRQLASAGYKLIVWRAHSALNMNLKYIAISTTDKSKFVNYDQYLENDQLDLCNITGDPDNLYFGITPKFIEQVMDGRFEDTVIVLMSCNGLKYDFRETAEAFEKKGVRVLISWDGWINASDNDIGADLLLRYLIDENYTVGTAVEGIPGYSFSGLTTHMQYYPYPEASDYWIPDYRGITVGAAGTAISVLVYSKTRKSLGLFQSNRSYQLHESL